MAFVQKWFGYAIGMTLILAFCIGATPHAKAQSICSQYGTVGDGSSEYIIQNNFYNPVNGTQCIDISNSSNGSFSVSTQTNYLPTNGSPGGYPSVFKGCHFGSCTDSALSNLPAQESDLASAYTSWSVSPISGGAWDIAYDIWFNQSPSTTGQENGGQPNGTEVMVWLNHSGATQPAGSKESNVNINGINFDVWVDPLNSNSFNNIWNIVSYVATTPTNQVNFSLLPFFQDAVNRGMLQTSWWLIDVEAGFEPWQGGAGLQSNGLSFGLSKYSQGAGGGTGINTSMWYSIVNQNSNACVDADNQGTSPGTQVIQWGCNGQYNQEWQLQSTDSGFYTVQNRNAQGLIWDATGANTGNETPIELWGYNTQWNDQWMPVSLGGNTYKFVNRLSGRCLDVPGATTNWGVQLQLYDCNGTGAQAYQLNPQQ